MSARRRGMMGAATNGWVDTGFDLAGFTHAGNTAISYSAETGELLLYTISNGSYSGVSKAFNWEPGYEYMVDYDVTVFAGTHRSSFRTGSTTYSPNSGSVTTSRHVNYIYGIQSHVIESVALYCTWSTSQYGACVISNFKIRKRLL